MSLIRNIAVIGASGNFGKPITAALRGAGYNVTIITRPESTTQHPDDVTVKRTEYTLDALTRAFSGQDAVVSVVGPPGISMETTFVDAAEAARVKRYVVSDFGWGPGPGSFPEFEAVHAERCRGWDHAKARADANAQFTWTGISTGNPIDWAIGKFAPMGWDIPHRRAIIYDDGTAKFTGTTLAGIGQAVLGVMQNPEKTANRFVKCFSIMTCQNDIMLAMEQATGQTWTKSTDTTRAIVERGRAKREEGTPGWILDLVVGQLFQEDSLRCQVASSRAESDSELLGVVEESARDVVDKALASTKTVTD